MKTGGASLAPVPEMPQGFSSWLKLRYQKNPGFLASPALYILPAWLWRLVFLIGCFLLPLGAFWKSCFVPVPFRYIPATAYWPVASPCVAAFMYHSNA